MAGWDPGTELGMRTIGRGLAGLALAFVALAGGSQSGAAQGQEVEPQTWRGEEVIAIDATRGLAVAEDQTMRVQIRNDLAPTGSVIISVVSLMRPESVLGAVFSNEAKEFLIDTRLYAGGFRLVARGSQAGTQVSRRIDVASQSRVKWNLSTGLVRLERLVEEAEDRG